MTLLLLWAAKRNNLRRNLAAMFSKQTVDEYKRLSRLYTECEYREEEDELADRLDDIWHDMIASEREAIRDWIEDGML